MLLRIKVQKGLFRSDRASRSHNIDVVCQECHGRIPPDEKFCPYCHVVILRRYCPGCRKLVPDHILICPYCGSSAGDKPKARILQYPMNVAAMILVLFIVTLYFLWPDQKSDQVKSPRSAADHRKVSISSTQPKQVNKITSKPQESATINVSKNVEKGARLNLEGHALIKQGRYREAVSLLNQAVETFPEDTNIIDYVFAQYNLAHSLRKIGKSEEAIPYLQRCIAYDSQNQMFQRELQAARRDVTRNENY